jgi:DNA-binding transcriptional MerR regulator
MPEKRDKENLISLEEFIKRAKALGVDFGKGDPKNRIRYLVKIGLLPHAYRKSFNGSPSIGAYPESVLQNLLEIDKKLKAGKTVQEIKREKEGEKFFDKNNFSSVGNDFDFGFLDTTKTLYHEISKDELEKSEKEILKDKKTLVFDNDSSFVEENYQKNVRFLIIRKIFNKKTLAIVSLLILVLSELSFIISFYQNKDFAPINLVNNFLKRSLDLYYSQISLASIFRLAQVDREVGQQNLNIQDQNNELKNAIPLSLIEPYLTINAPVDVNGILNVKDGINASSLSLSNNNFGGKLVVGNLTNNRDYILPDASGTICLTTGNCFGLNGEVVGSNGISNRLAKFSSSNRITNSSISDLFNGGIALNIDALGRIGVGVANPQHALHVNGRIQASGDICTDLAGGRCLSTLPLGGAPSVVVSNPPTVIGVSGSGTSGYLPLWSTSSSLGNSIMFQNNNKIGIGTASPSSLLTVAGDVLFNGPLKISTTTLGQLILEFDSSNYLRFAIDSNKSEIQSSKTMVIDSLTGEIRLGNNTNLFNAFGATVQAATFVSTTTDSTVRKSGERVFRGSVPIFLYPVPSQTNSISFVPVSLDVSTSTLDSVLPQKLPGSTREMALLINFADNIPTSATSSWIIDLSSGPDQEFYFEGQNLPSLDKGFPHLSNFFALPQENWQLRARSPSSANSIRIFNILLLIYDKIN